MAIISRAFRRNGEAAAVVKEEDGPFFEASVPSNNTKKMVPTANAAFFQDCEVWVAAGRALLVPLFGIVWWSTWHVMVG